MSHSTDRSLADPVLNPLVLGGLAAVTFSTYFLAVATGKSWGIWIFLLPWAVIILLRPRLVAENLAGTLIWLLPALCLLSTIWSRAPAATFRAAVEYILFTFVTLTLAKVVHRRWITFGMTVGLLLVVGLSLASGRGGLLFNGGGAYALTGLFASKNALVFSCGLLTISALVGALDRNMPFLARLVCLGGVVLGPVVGYMGHSLGGLVALMSAGLMVVTMSIAAKLPQSLRLSFVAIVIAVIVIITTLVLAMSDDSRSSLLLAVGKTPDLTGRGLLWQQARVAIEDNPYLGVGFFGYWSPIFADAQGLYRALGIKSESGFHFHNLYYETAVELGIPGILVMVITLGGVLFMALREFVTAPTVMTGFVLGTLTLLLSRVSLEVDFLSPFSTGAMLLTICYQVLRLQSQARAAEARYLQPRQEEGLRQIDQSYWQRSRREGSRVGYRDEETAA